MSSFTAAGNPQFTCLSCSIAFATADDQRDHYKSDHHRYNMKRRVASLPPITAAAFNAKVLERKAETAVTVSLKGTTCGVCYKVYTTENSYVSHVQSKKHKENEAKAARTRKQVSVPPPETTEPISTDKPATLPEDGTTSAPSAPIQPAEESPAALGQGEDVVMKDSDDGDATQTIEQRIAASRNSLTTSHCLFCTYLSESLESNLTHMSNVHSFFIPDAEFLIDLPGLITYLGEKLAVGNVCLYCNGKGRELRSLEAVRKHMVDKSHCKIAYDSGRDQLEISDYYDFSSSYPEATRRTKRIKRSKVVTEEDEEWQDEDGSIGDADEAVEVEVLDDATSGSEDEDSEIGESGVTFGDTPYELVLPSGSRIGHRSMRRYYVQHFRPQTAKTDTDSNSGAALVRQLIADKNSALVPMKGGFGAFGNGLQVVKAKNKGEAKEAGRHIREHRDMARKEAFRTKVGFIHNSQKHYRDPLLQ